MDIQKSGETQSGVYTVHVASRSILVYCDMVTDGGGWLVIQRRVDGSQNFRLGWNDYAAGFGSVTGEFWLGNRNIHLLTSMSQDVSLRYDMADGEGNKRYAQYDFFKVKSEAEKFKLIVSGYTGDAGDTMSTSHNGMKFSTTDQDNDIYSGDCAALYKGGWWYDECHVANPNGLYLNGSHESSADGINWKPWKGYHYSLQFFEMKIRPHF
ncbi:hypothetical protein CAPTEDRAFT_3786 [Capitella teleta]|uniref:Fibrinogen C-terminal domain-containing protein n=1 Tax=Capitella teleta TaxID=283909 RepID=R7UI89_CAPTE|nr:hypothetical protein CAPTEDRAFT_3786 [Capitella teleta]|eukprot:ELU06279.1 hypothetical protein CAPTEDRAFT_3786 [Capitella teleta]